MIAAADFALAATSSQAMTRVPLLQPDSLITQVREGCGPVVMVNGQCVSRHAIRQARRCIRWNGNVAVTRWAPSMTRAHGARHRLRDVAYWHLADKSALLNDVCFGG